MRQSDYPKIVTFVAAPPQGVPATDNPFIARVVKTLANKPGNHVVRVASVRDIDLELSKLPSPDEKRPIRAQIVGHSMSGALALGAVWLPSCDMHVRGFAFPYYALDSNPAALGLLSKHAGKLSELMLVACNIGSADASGYPISGRVLTYTLAELLRCSVFGADDVIAPDEFDTHGWYAPVVYPRRSPKGWRWVQDGPPTWVDAAAIPSSRRIKAA